MSKVILVTSGKGGTGKTMFSVNLGATFAKMGKKTLIIDMDFGLRNLDLYLGLENNIVYDVYDVMMGVCRIKQGIIKDKRIDNLHMMAASPKNDYSEITPLHMKVLCKSLREKFDYIIIDTAAGMDDTLYVAAADCDEAVIITAPEYAALRDADIIDRILMEMGIKRRSVVLNKVVLNLIESGYAPTVADISQVLRPDIVGIIQQDENIQISTNLGIPIVIKDDIYLAENFKNIAERLL